MCLWKSTLSKATCGMGWLLTFESIFLKLDSNVIGWSFYSLNVQINIRTISTLDSGCFEVIFFMSFLIHYYPAWWPSYCLWDKFCSSVGFRISVFFHSTKYLSYLPVNTLTSWKLVIYTSFLDFIVIMCLKYMFVSCLYFGNKWYMLVGSTFVILLLA